ncbi:MAG: tryptophan synthase subunit alpha [Acidimicrobiales bacterium]
MTGTPVVSTNRLDEVFHRGRPALVCYLPIGDPVAQHANPGVYLDQGVDVLEVGVPAADPRLDGPVIASSMRRARACGMNNSAAARFIRAFREQLGDPATVWMTYPSAADEPEWITHVTESGVHGTLIAGGAPGDHPTPPGIHQVGFLPHHPTDAQVAAAATATGYVMVAADDGVSGARTGLLPANRALLDRVRASGVTAPLALGFGIAGGDDARAAVACGADGIVVGSAVVAAAMDSAATLRALLQELRKAIDE